MQNGKHWMNNILTEITEMLRIVWIRCCYWHSSLGSSVLAYSPTGMSLSDECYIFMSLCDKIHVLPIPCNLFLHLNRGGCHSANTNWGGETWLFFSSFCMCNTFFNYLPQHACCADKERAAWNLLTLKIAKWKNIRIYKMYIWLHSLIAGWMNHAAFWTIEVLLIRYTSQTFLQSVANESNVVVVDNWNFLGD